MAALFNVTNQAVSEWERDESRPESDKLPILADFLGTTVDKLMRDSASAGTSTPAPNPREEIHAPVIRRVELDSNLTFPIHSAVEGGAGAFIISSEPIDWTIPPAGLRKVADAYGVLVSSDSMIPAFRPGDIAFVHPHLPPSPNTEVILEREERDGTRYGMIKTLVRVGAKDYRLKQWNPEEEFSKSKKEWPKCQTVVGRFKR